MEEKIKAFVARDKSGDLYLYIKKPHKEGCGGRLSWVDNETYASLPNELFPNVKWEDKEPAEVEIIIKTK